MAKKILDDRDSLTFCLRAYSYRTAVQVQVRPYDRYMVLRKPSRREEEMGAVHLSPEQLPPIYSWQRFAFLSERLNTPP